jgi:Eukaryotic aspartyl protease
MGLAKGQLSNQGVLTPIESLAKAGTIDAAITSFKISRFADGKNDGQVTIGAIDKSIINPATLVNIPNVNPNGFWEGQMDAITVNGGDTGLTGKTAILDTVSWRRVLRETWLTIPFLRAPLSSSLPRLTLPLFMLQSPALSLMVKADSQYHARPQHPLR